MDIEKAEGLLEVEFPPSVRSFYNEVGSGWYSSEQRPDIRNLVIHPLDVVDLYKGCSQYSPPEGFLSGDVPVFDCGGHRFLVVRPFSPKPDEVYRDDGVLIAESFEIFIERLINDEVFYEKIENKKA